MSRADWRRIGNALIIKSLPSPASGPVERVWFDATGERLYAATALGKAYETGDFERWLPSRAAAPAPERQIEALTRPGEPVELRAQRRRSVTVYAFGRHVWRSDNEGGSWANVTSWKGQSILGGQVRDLAVSPRNEKQVVAATRDGVWMSMDGGLSWSGLNEDLPNLPVRRILAVPSGGRGVTALSGEGPGEVIEWRPGQKAGWQATGETGTQALVAEALLMAALPRQPDGRVVRLWQSAPDSRSMLAVTAMENGYRVLRSVNGGDAWDDMTSDLRAGTVFAATGDVRSGTIYVATEMGVFLMRSNLTAPVAAGAWQRVEGELPAGPVLDVVLDADGNQLYAAVEGIGVWATLAPHRAWSPAVVHSADYVRRAAAPGALLSILGVAVQSASAGTWTVPVLSSTSAESQIQVPFTVQGDQVALVVATDGGTRRFDLPVRATAPAILVDRDGSPMILDGETGMPVEAVSPARSGARVQILATGLGRVVPDWPTGLPAPVEGSPRVAAPVRVLLDGVPVEVARAILAPGYIGYYLVEIILPDFVNRGAGDIVIESGGQASNRVRIYLDR